MKRFYELNLYNQQCLTDYLQTKYSDKFIKKNLWKYTYLITAIINKRIFTEPTYCGKYYEISTQKLKDNLGRISINGKKVWVYTIIRQDLQDAGLIKYHTVTNTDVTVYKTAYYYIKQHIIKGGWSVIEGAFMERATKEKPIKYNGIYGKLQKSIQNITILPEAIDHTNQMLTDKAPLRMKKKGYAWISRTMNAEIHACYLAKIRAIQEKDFNFSVDVEKTGRIFNNVSNLPKPLRSYLRFNNKPLTEIDISCCQPLIFTTVIKKYAEANGCSQEPDIVLYQSLCESGQIYSYLQNQMECNGVPVERDTLKIDFFSKILFSTEKIDYSLRKIFAAEFPTVDKAISDYKKGNYKRLAINMQRLEAEIVMTVTKRLFDKNVTEFYTLHDAIYCTAEHTEAVYNEIVTVFGEYGLQPLVKIDGAVAV